MRIAVRPQRSPPLRRASRCSRSRAARAPSRVDTNPPLPNVLLLIDNSGSMERMIDGNTPGDRRQRLQLHRHGTGNGPPADVASLPAPNRWNMLQAMTGSLRTGSAASRCPAPPAAHVRRASTRSPASALRHQLLPRSTGWSRPTRRRAARRACVVAPGGLPGATRAGRGLGAGSATAAGAGQSATDFPPAGSSCARTRSARPANGDRRVSQLQTHAVLGVQYQDGAITSTTPHALRADDVRLGPDPGHGRDDRRQPARHRAGAVNARRRTARSRACGATSRAGTRGQRHLPRATRRTAPPCRCWPWARATRAPRLGGAHGALPGDQRPRRRRRQQRRDLERHPRVAPLRRDADGRHVRGRPVLLLERSDGPQQTDPLVFSGYRPQYIILLTDGAPNLDLQPTARTRAQAAPPSVSGACPFPRPDHAGEPLRRRRPSQHRSRRTSSASPSPTCRRSQLVHCSQLASGGTDGACAEPPDASSPAACSSASRHGPRNSGTNCVVRPSGTDLGLLRPDAGGPAESALGHPRRHRQEHDDANDARVLAAFTNVLSTIRTRRHQRVSSSRRSIRRRAAAGRVTCSGSATSARLRGSLHRHPAGITDPGRRLRAGPQLERGARAHVHRLPAGRTAAGGSWMRRPRSAPTWRRPAATASACTRRRCTRARRRTSSRHHPRGAGHSAPCPYTSNVKGAPGGPGLTPAPCATMLLDYTFGQPLQRGAATSRSSRATATPSAASTTRTRRSWAPPPRSSRIRRTSASGRLADAASRWCTPPPTTACSTLSGPTSPSRRTTSCGRCSCPRRCPTSTGRIRRATSCSTARPS